MLEPEKGIFIEAEIMLILGTNYGASVFNFLPSQVLQVYYTILLYMSLSKCVFNVP